MLSFLARNDPSNVMAIATGLVALLGTGSTEAEIPVTQMLITFIEEHGHVQAIAEVRVATDSLPVFSVTFACTCCLLSLLMPC